MKIVERLCSLTCGGPQFAVVLGWSLLKYESMQHVSGCIHMFVTFPS